MKNPFKWAADHIKKLFGCVAQPMKKRGKFKSNPTIPKGALYQFLAQLDFGAKARKEAKLSASAKRRNAYLDLTTTEAFAVPKGRRPSEIEFLATEAAAASRRVNPQVRGSRQLTESAHKWNRRIRRALRTNDATHLKLSNRGIPRRKDGNRLGLRRRLEMASANNPPA